MVRKFKLRDDAAFSVEPFINDDGLVASMVFFSFSLGVDAEGFDSSGYKKALIDKAGRGLRVTEWFNFRNPVVDVEVVVPGLDSRYFDDDELLAYLSDIIGAFESVPVEQFVFRN